MHHKGKRVISTKSIVLLANEPETDRQRHRLELDLVDESIIKIEYRYISGLNTHTDHPPVPLRTLFFELDQVNQSADVILWVFPAIRWRSILAFQYLRIKRRIPKQGLLYIKPIPTKKRSTKLIKAPAKSKVLEAVVNKIILKMGMAKLPWSHLIISGSECEKFLKNKVKDIEKTKKIYVNSQNYKEFSRSLTGLRRANFHDIGRGLFVDQGLPFHPDYLRGYIDPEEYYSQIYELLSAIEASTGKKIDVAPHPRVPKRRTKDSPFSEINKTTQTASKDYDFCVTLFSTAVEFFLFHKKPIVIIEPDCIKGQFPEIAGLAEALGVNIYTKGNQINLAPISDLYYRMYVKRFSGGFRDGNDYWKNYASFLNGNG